MSFREFRQTHDAADGVVLQTLPVAARAMQGERAGFVTRTIAAVIDVVITGAIVLGIWVAGWLFLLVFSPSGGESLPPPGYFLLSGYVVLWAYWTWCWATSGRSPGQSLMGVRVLDRHDQRPSWGLAAVRSAFCIVFQIGIVWVLVSRRNRSVQDVVLGTSVIHDWSSRVATGRVAPLDSQQAVVEHEQSAMQSRAEHVADSIEDTFHRRTSDSSQRDRD
ncbi:MAG: RDD family protein [Candidatus Nanopelagicales bacterium]